MANSADNKVVEDAPDLGTPEVRAASLLPSETQATGSSAAFSKRSQAGTKKVVLLVVWLALLVGIVVWINLAGRPPAPISAPPSNPMPRLNAANLEAQWPQIMAHAAAPARGSAGARYTIAEFGDFQCPQCGKARPVLEKMLAQYPAQVNLIFVQRPLPPRVHEWAFPSGQAAEVAAAQGKFWPMYDVLYTHQDDLEPGFYGDYAATAGLDRAAFQKAFDAKQGAEKLAASSALADTLDIQETPTILVRDNVAKTVKIYIGLNTNGNRADNVPFPGLDDLTAGMPWAK